MSKFSKAERVANVSMPGGLHCCSPEPCPGQAAELVWRGAAQAPASPPPCRALAARLAAAQAPADSPAGAAKARAARTHAPGAFADVTNVGAGACRPRLRAHKAIIA